MQKMGNIGSNCGDWGKNKQKIKEMGKISQNLWEIGHGYAPCHLFFFLQIVILAWEKWE